MSNSNPNILKIVESVSRLDTVTSRGLMRAVRAAVSNPEDVQPSYLQMFATLANTKVSYDFDVAQGRNETVALPISKLRDTEAFVITRLRIALLRVVNTTGVPMGYERVQTFVNPNVFAAATGFTPEHLNALYNSELSWLTNTKQVQWSGLSTRECEWIPQVQDIGGTSETQVEPNAGFIEPPSISVLDGGETNKFTLALPEIANQQMASVTAGVHHVIAFRAEGLRIKSI